MGKLASASGTNVIEVPCSEDMDRWFPEGYLGKQDHPGDVGQPDYHSEEAMAARVLCAGCPLRQPCLEGAIERREEYGIYGGLDPDERTVEETKRAMQQMR